MQLCLQIFAYKKGNPSIHYIITFLQRVTKRKDLEEKFRVKVNFCIKQERICNKMKDLERIFAKLASLSIQGSDQWLWRQNVAR